MQNLSTATRRGGRVAKGERIPWEPTLKMATIWTKSPNLYQRSVKHHDHYRCVPTRENANGLHKIQLRANLFCNKKSWFYFLFDVICMSLEMICISKRAINFHPSISIKASGINSHYSGQPQTSSYNQGTYNQTSYSQGFLQPGVLHQGVLTTRGCLKTRGLTTKSSYNQGSYNLVS